MGDVNFDHKVNINDITSYIDYILNPQDVTINERRADYNNDGELNISDIVSIIDTILTTD